MGKTGTSKALFVISVVTVIFSAIGALGLDLWLASTQWLIVAGVLAIWAIYFEVCCCKSN